MSDELGSSNSEKAAGKPAKKEEDPTQLVLFAVRETATSEMWSGPVPDPKALAAYKEVDPSFPTTLIDEFKHNGKHRRKCETIEVITEAIIKIGGLITAGLIAYYALSTGRELIQAGKDITGLSLIITAIGSLVGAFIYGKRKAAIQTPTMLVAQPEIVTTNEQSIERLSAAALGKKPPAGSESTSE